MAETLHDCKGLHDCMFTHDNAYGLVQAYKSVRIDGALGSSVEEGFYPCSLISVGSPDALQIMA